MAEFCRFGAAQSTINHLRPPITIKKSSPVAKLTRAGPACQDLQFAGTARSRHKPSAWRFNEPAPLERHRLLAQRVIPGYNTATTTSIAPQRPCCIFATGQDFLSRSREALLTCKGITYKTDLVSDSFAKRLQKTICRGHGGSIQTPIMWEKNKMTNTKWLRRALLGGVALSVMASGAQADELSALKAQLEALQTRVNNIETKPAPSLPAGASYVTLNRGQGSFANSSFGQEAKREGAIPADRGFTVAVTPTADMPAPVAEVVVYGYVKGDVIYQFSDSPTSFSLWLPSNIRRSNNDHISLSARQTRFGIRSKVDTAIGQIRTLIEVDFTVNGGGTSAGFRMRHARGEWDLAPYWTLTIGQTWYTAALLPIGVTTVDWGGSAGITYSRTPQVKLTYKNGPITWAVGIERATFNTSTNVPNFGAYFQYDVAGGHQFVVTAALADFRDRAVGAHSGSNLGWAVQAGANINLADIATLTVGGLIGQGEVRRYLSQEGFANVGANGRLVKAWGVTVGLSFAVSETTTFNVQYGRSQQKRNQAFAGACATCVVHADTVHANILWRPVKQMRLGWEVMWGRNTYRTVSHDSVVRAQFGAWFFF